MLFIASLTALLGLACASPAPKLSPRQSGPNYPVYNFDQLVRLNALDNYSDTDTET